MHWSVLSHLNQTHALTALEYTEYPLFRIYHSSVCDGGAPTEYARYLADVIRSEITWDVVEAAIKHFEVAYDVAPR